MKVVAFTKVAAPYGWLGNMSKFPITYQERVWPTAEHLFQALRFQCGHPIQEEIRVIPSPMAAKMRAKHNSVLMVVRPRSPEDVSAMELVLVLKLEQHPALVDQLLATGDAVLVEDITKRRASESAVFWGARKTETGWEGENQLGKLWTALRARALAARATSVP